MLFRIIILQFLILASCTTHMKEIDMVFSDDIIKNKASNIEFNYFLDGYLDFTLQATHMSSTDSEIEFYDGFKLIAYDKELNELAVISSDHAIENKDDEIVKVSKNVILINANNEQLNTDYLIWDRFNKKIYTDDFVTISTNDQLIMGYGFISDEKFINYSLSNITGTLYL